MSYQYASDVIDDLYLEGDRDYIFFEQIVGLIRFDSKDERKKISDIEVQQGAIDLVEFLVESGDFCLALGRKRQGDGGVDFEIYHGNRGELIAAALSSIASSDFQYRIVLQKIRKGVAAPPVPGRIIDLLS